MLRKMTKVVKMMAKMVTKIISRSLGKCGSANKPVLAVPAVSSVDRQAIEVTCKRAALVLIRFDNLVGP